MWFPFCSFQLGLLSSLDLCIIVFIKFRDNLTNITLIFFSITPFQDSNYICYYLLYIYFLYIYTIPPLGHKILFTFWTSLWVISIFCSVWYTVKLIQWNFHFRYYVFQLLMFCLLLRDPFYFFSCVHGFLWISASPHDSWLSVCALHAGFPAPVSQPGTCSAVAALPWPGLHLCRSRLTSALPPRLLPGAFPRPPFLSALPSPPLPCSCSGPRWTAWFERLCHLPAVGLQPVT